MNEETKLMNEIQAKVNIDGHIRLFRNAVGQSGVMCSSCRVKSCGKCMKRLSTVVRYGLTVGSGDLVGFVIGTGKFVSFEIKTKTGKPTPEQIKWKDWVNLNGGYACIVHSVEEALFHVDKCCKGEDSG